MPDMFNRMSCMQPDGKEFAMRPWIKRTLYAVFGFGFIAAALGAWAHRHGHHAMNFSPENVAQWRGRVLERAGSELKLDEAQKQRLGTLFDKLNEQRAALVGATPDPRSEMKALVAGERFDRQRATALVQDKTGAVAAKSPEVIAAAGDFYDSLNPEQQAKVRAFLERRGGHWGRHGRHGDQGGDRDRHDG